MNTFTRKLRVGAVGLSLVSTCVVGLPAHAQEGRGVTAGSVTVQAPKDAKVSKAASKQENIGVLTGLAVGAAAGGPVGAIVGAAAGAWIGDRYHKKEVAAKALKGDLSESEAQRAVLAKNLEELHASLDDARAKSDQLGTDVSFRTNEDQVGPQALVPLTKLGMLAASMPDVKVRVAGFADPRGSEKVNDELSRRRAEAVAAVLAQAGVPKDHMIVEGHGKGESTSMEGDVDGYAFDRKVTVRLERVGNQEVARND